jgi:hypothetical protein
MDGVVLSPTGARTIRRQEATMALLDPAAVRADNEIEVDLLDGTSVLARKEDMLLLLFDGRVPLPMLAAVQRMIDMPKASPEERMGALGEHGKDLVKLIREHAVNVVIKPKLTLTDTGEPGTIPVSYMRTTQLMEIWKATAVLPRVTTAEASTFRDETVEPTADAPHDGEGVSPPAVHVGDAGAPELVRQ